MRAEFNATVRRVSVRTRDPAVGRERTHEGGVSERIGLLQVQTRRFERGHCLIMRCQQALQMGTLSETLRLSGFRATRDRGQEREVGVLACLHIQVGLPGRVGRTRQVRAGG